MKGIKGKEELMMNLLFSVSVMAATGYLHAIEALKGVLITIGSGIGAVMLVYGAIKFAMAFRQLDQQGEHQAVYSVVAGGILIGLSALVSALS